MSKDYVQSHKPARSAEAQAWLDGEIRDQERRYAAIVEEQEAWTSEREKAYTEFLEIVQTKGYNVTGDQRRVIDPEEVPQKPDRADALRVVW